MKKRKLGNTGIEISEIAFGGVEIGLPYGIGVNSDKDMLSEEEAIDLLHLALDSGINFFDTARMYGNSEHIMGKAFKNKRSEVILATKCVHLLNDDGGLPSGRKLKEKISTSLFDSLESLQTDHVDLFMLHQAPTHIIDNEEIISIFSALKEQGLFKASGVSTYTTEETRIAIEKNFWNIIQLPFNLMDQRQSVCFEEAHSKGIGIVVRSVLLKGLLSNRGKNLHPALKDVENHIAKYHELLEGTNYDLPRFATKFALSFPYVSSVLLGFDRQEYLGEALKTVDGIYLSKAKLERARQLAYPEPEFINLPYWDKMKWLT